MPEQLTEEDLKNMSPEQLAELQKQNCIFCHLSSGQLPSKKVYEDDLVFAIVDINPAAKGHILLMPKDHCMVMPQCPELVIKRLGKISKMISRALIKALGAEGTNIFIANGAAAGQRAPHLIVHIIPRNDRDGLVNFEIPEKSMVPEDILKAKNALMQRLGYKSGQKIIEQPQKESGSREFEFEKIIKSKKALEKEKGVKKEIKKEQPKELEKINLGKLKEMIE